ncbi:MAG TPA: hypothetical protein VJ867_13605 [Gemmatimonadaceae bacterium]|nr:hypothetical protein [Gemmatimonadaceae bacterium]
MAGLKLDGAGTAKMATLEECTILHQRIHTLVEQYALAIKRNQPASHLMMNLKRQMPALAGKLKGQFGMISDLVTAVNMAMTRGSSEQMRVRSMREGVAAIKVQLDIATAQTIAKHEQKDEHDEKHHDASQG